MNLFRKSLAKRQNLSERAPAVKDLLYYLEQLEKAASTQAKLDTLDTIWAGVQELPISTSTKKTLSLNLDELTTAIKTNDHSDAEILLDTITSTLARL